MSLIEEIQKEAVDSMSDLGALLRKCKLLAARLASKPLEDWLVWEANGYPDGTDVPSYRVWSLQVKGQFSGALGPKLLPVPWVCLPERDVDGYQNYRCRQSITSLEEMVKRADSGILRINTGDLAVKLGTGVYQGHNCVEAWAEVGVGQVIEVLNSVRNRVLDFALALWREAPDSGEQGGMSPQAMPPGRVTQIFSTTVYGGSANLVGTATESTVTFTISQGDLDALEKALRSKGVEARDVEELHAALDDDDRPRKSGVFGPRVSSWIGKMTQKAADGTWAIGIQAAGNLLAQAIAKYYGL